MKIKIAVLTLLLTATCAFAQKLPTTVIPIHYDLKFTPNLNDATFAGEEQIAVNLSQPGTSITLNSAEIKFLSATITSGKQRQTATVTIDEKSEMATLTVPTTMAAGPASIDIKFEGILNDKLRGFYLSKAGGRNYAVTQFEATDARRAFPSFDEPEYKASYTITLVIPKDDTAISNEAVASDTPGPSANEHTLRFRTTKKMSTYLVAMLVGQFDCVSGQQDGIPMRVCVTPEKKGMEAFALEAMEHEVAYYNRYFGIKYPFGKLDLIGIPDFEAGAMENAGAITFRETALLVDPQHASENQRKNVAGVIAHEIAHQWFGDLVTMEWWNDIWLNEGFATFMAPKAVEAWKPEWHPVLDAQGEKDWAEGSDSTRSSRPIRAKEANTPQEIATLFDGIAYGKGASVLRMIESYVGDETFRKGIQNYLHAHEYANATSEDLWNALGKASGKPVEKIMSSFVLQPGVPMVTVSTACQEGQTAVTVTQQRYYENAKELAQGSSELWNIPLCYRAAGAKQTACQVITAKQQTFTVPGCGWINVDADGTGYYVGGYASEDFRRLAAAVNDLTPAERISFYHDTWQMITVGKQPIGDGLTLAADLHNERGPVLSTVIGPLGGIEERLVTDEDRPEFQQWLRNLLNPVLSDVGWTPKEGESDDVRSVRPDLIYTLGYRADDPQVVAKCQQLAQAYMRDSTSVVPDLAGIVLHVAAAHGNEQLYDAYLAQMKAAKSPAVYYAYFRALTDFTDPKLVERTMQLAFSPDVRNQDLPGLLFGIMGNPASQQAGWKYLKAHYDEFAKRMPAGLDEDVAAGLVSGFCDAASRDDAKAFLEPKLAGHPQRPLNEALDNINNCIAAKDAQAPQLAQWLKQNAAAGEQ